MEEVAEKSLDDLGFKVLSDTTYARIYSAEKIGAIACVLKQEYIPIKYFKEIFHKLTSILENGGYRKFIFDKRSLRTFHQPSMEWYFIEWKTEILKYGVSQHRKILPDLAWFVKAVEIAKAPLWEKLPAEAKQKLDIVYCTSYEDAIAK